ncbi:MAG TPA: hypothetical protein VIX12_05370, partial [Candidatus Binataceae bacterium]
MKIQAHLPEFGIGAREWRAGMIALISLSAASALLLTLHSTGAVNNSPFDRIASPLMVQSNTQVPHRIALDVSPLKHRSMLW